MTADIEHRQGCPATGGYGHGVEPCICGAATVVELLLPIERDEAMDRTYIPLPGGWEVQTKGNGSTFRICEPGDDPMRLAVPASPYLHDTLARMARDIHAAVSHHTAARDAEIEALRAEVERLKRELSARGDYVNEQAIARAERLRVEVRNLRDDAHRRSSEIAALGDAVQHWMKRAERLAEALQWYVDNDDTNDGQDGNEFWIAGRDRARALLHEQEE